MIRPSNDIGRIDHSGQTGDGAELRGQGFCGVMAAQTLAVLTLHMTEDTLLFETLLKMLVLHQTERAILILMENLRVMAVPAPVTWEVSRGVPGRIAVGLEFRLAGSRINHPRSTMTGSSPLGKIDLSAGAVELAKVIDIGIGGAMAISTDHRVMDRTAPLRVRAGMTDRVATGLGGGVIGAAVLEVDILDPIDVSGRVDVLILGHINGGDNGVMTVQTATTADGADMTIVAGKPGKEVSVMGIGLVSERSGVRIHGHSGKPALLRELVPVSAVPAVTVTARGITPPRRRLMSMTGVTLLMPASPGIIPHFGIDRGPVAVAIDIATDLGCGDILGRRHADNSPLIGIDFDIDGIIEMGGL